MWWKKKRVAQRGADERGRRINMGFWFRSGNGEDTFESSNWPLILGIGFWVFIWLIFPVVFCLYGPWVYRGRVSFLIRALPGVVLVFLCWKSGLFFIGIGKGMRKDGCLCCTHTSFLDIVRGLNIIMSCSALR